MQITSESNKAFHQNETLYAYCFVTFTSPERHPKPVLFVLLCFCGNCVLKWNRKNRGKRVRGEVVLAGVPLASYCLSWGKSDSPALNTEVQSFLSSSSQLVVREEPGSTDTIQNVVA